MAVSNRWASVCELQCCNDKFHCNSNNKATIKNASVMIFTISHAKYEKYLLHS